MVSIIFSFVTTTTSSRMEGTSICPLLILPSAKTGLLLAIFVAERLDRTARRAIVRRQDGIEICTSFRNCGARDLLRIFGFPVLRPILVHDFQLALVDQRNQHLVLSSLVEERVVVRFRTINADDLFLSVLRKMIDEKLRLQLAHFLVVKSHIKIEIAIGD